MVVQTPPPPPAPELETEAGPIKDARARQRRHRLIGVALSAAAAGIAALILGIGGGGRTGRADRTSHARPSGPGVPRAATGPRFVGGMGGDVAASWASFSGEHGSIWLVQCIGCIGESSKAVHAWRATTTNGGASWRVQRRRYAISDAPVWDGANDWSATVGGEAPAPTECSSS